MAFSAKALNRIIDLVHENRLTKQQFVMFSLADMMTSVEVAAALARKAGALLDSSDPSFEKTAAASRIFAWNTAHMVAENTMKIVNGSGVFDDAAVNGILESISYRHLAGFYPGLIRDMDQVADFLFER